MKRVENDVIKCYNKLCKKEEKIMTWKEMKDRTSTYYHKVKFACLVCILIGAILGAWGHAHFYSNIRLNEAKILKGIVINGVGYDLVQKP